VSEGTLANFGEVIDRFAMRGRQRVASKDHILGQDKDENLGTFFFFLHVYAFLFRDYALIGYFTLSNHCP